MNSSPQSTWRNTYNYPIQGPQYQPNTNPPILLSKGHHPEPLNFKLESQQQAIKSIAISNPKNLNTKVSVFGGPSDAGLPIFVCLPGKSARASVEGNFPLHVKFDPEGGLGPGLPPDSGYIFIAVTSEMGPEYFSGDSTSIDSLPDVTIESMPPVVISPDSAPITIGTMPPVTIQSMPPVVVQQVDYPPLTSPPSDAVQVYISPTVNTATFAANARIQLDPLTLITNRLYTRALEVGGFHRQPFLEWRFTTRGISGNYNLLVRGWGNVQVIFPLNYYNVLRSQSAQGIYFDVINSASIIGNLPINVFYSGYTQ